ncbi:MAG TPA: hypothetical protein VEQ58_13645, partial [Polyangiaceae bacterium]|nr:hypothetical protein [Polyangiaceae bacterium]
VLRVLDGNEEPLPSTKPNRRRARAPEWSLETTGPMVLGAAGTPRDAHGGRRPWLVLLAVLLCVGAAYGALQAIFATSALAPKPAASLTAPAPSAVPKRAEPAPSNALHDHVAPPSSASLAAPSKARRDARPPRSNAPIGRGSAPPALKVAASAEPAPPAPLATKPRVRLLDEGSLVKLIQ